VLPPIPPKGGLKNKMDFKVPLGGFMGEKKEIARSFSEINKFEIIL
jgi:hypothetical protein